MQQKYCDHGLSAARLRIAWPILRACSSCGSGGNARKASTLPSANSAMKLPAGLVTQSMSLRGSSPTCAAVSTRSATDAGVRLGRAGRGRQVRLEHLARGAVAEAAPGRVVEPVGEQVEADPPERLGRALARQGAPGAAVQVLDAALRMLA